MFWNKEETVAVQEKVVKKQTPLQKVKMEINTIFEKEMVIPEYSHHTKRQLTALKEANLTKQQRLTKFNARCEMAKELGFRELSIEDMTTMLGEKNDNSYLDEYRGSDYTHEYFYDHINQSLCNDRTTRPYLINVKCVNGSYNNLLISNLDNLKIEIPYGIVLRLNEIKKLNFFNCFNVVAPESCFRQLEYKDPIVLATICEAHDKVNLGSRRYFFLAQW